MGGAEKSDGCSRTNAFLRTFSRVRFYEVSPPAPFDRMAKPSIVYNGLGAYICMSHTLKSCTNYQMPSCDTHTGIRTYCMERFIIYFITCPTYVCSQ